jgi:hypothetical protein
MARARTPLLFDDPHLCIRYEADPGCLYERWRGFVRSDRYRALMELCFDMLVEYGPLPVVVDAREFAPIARADQEWTADIWFPRAASAGLAFVAVLLPESVIAEMSVRDVMSRSGDKIFTTFYTSNLDEAYQWVRDRTRLRRVVGA